LMCGAQPAGPPELPSLGSTRSRRSIERTSICVPRHCAPIVSFRANCSVQWVFAGREALRSTIRRKPWSVPWAGFIRGVTQCDASTRASFEHWSRRSIILRRSPSIACPEIPGKFARSRLLQSRTDLGVGIGTGCATLAQHSACPGRPLNISRSNPLSDESLKPLTFAADISLNRQMLKRRSA
jgi:hypothetical protein